MKTKASAYNTHNDFRDEISEKNVRINYYTRRVNRFICNILYMIHSSNSVLRSGGEGGGVGSVSFLEDTGTMELL